MRTLTKDEVYIRLANLNEKHGEFFYYPANEYMKLPKPIHNKEDIILKAKLDFRIKNLINILIGK